MIVEEVWVKVRKCQTLVNGFIGKWWFDGDLGLNNDAFGRFVALNWKQ